ncbi:MAG: SdrD B-like domain-containing protein [Gemmataceae bacterium]
MTDLDAGLYANGSIGDRVWNDLDQDGIQDPAEGGLSGVTVNLLDESGEWLASTTTGGTGEYQFTGLPAGTYRLEVVAPTGYQLSPPDQSPDDTQDSDFDPTSRRTAAVSLSAGQTRTDVDAGLNDGGSGGSGGSITGRMWQDADADGVQDAGEAAQPWTPVNLLDGYGNWLAGTVTGWDGSYQFGGLAPGVYRVRFTPPSGNLFSPPDQGGNDALDSDPDPATGEASVTVGSGQAVTAVDAGVYPATALAGRVWADGDADGVQDAGEPDVAGVTVSLLDAADAVVATAVTPDSGGGYQFSGLLAGSYRVQVALPSGYQFSPQDQGYDDTLDSDVDPGTGRSALVALAPGQTGTRLDAGLAVPPPTAGVGDRVWDDFDRDGVQDSGEPGLSGVTVVLLDNYNMWLATATSNWDGGYQFGSLPAGSYRLLVFAYPSGYQLSPQDQGSDDTLDSDIDPSTGGSAAFTLSAGQVRTDVDVGLYSAGSGGSGGSIGDRVWDDLDQDGVQDQGEYGLGGVTVNLLDSYGNWLTSTTSGWDGSYTFSGLSAGSYRIEVVAPWGYQLSPQDQGYDDALDSDIDPGTGRTAVLTLSSGQNRTDVDAGLYYGGSGGSGGSGGWRAAAPQADLGALSAQGEETMVYPVATETVFRNADGTGAQTTTYTYTWFPDSGQVKSQTVTRPAVSTAQNGPGTPASETTVFDRYGRVTWSKDAAGFLSYTEYDAATGAVVKTITDVDSTRSGDFADLPEGWSTPAGGGLHLTTRFEVDSQGRVTKTTAPNGRGHLTVYNDDGREVRTYRGWDAATGRPTGPTEVSREDRGGGYTETLTMTATPTLDAQGRPTGQEAIGGLQTLSRSYTNTGGQLMHVDTYFDLTGLSYSTSTALGVEGVHYARSFYGYNRRGWQNRELSPTGTITRTVYDPLGRVTAVWVGTDDTPASGGWSPTNTAGTDLVRVTSYQYDSGGSGDGNLTQVTQYPGGGAANRVTQYWYDWRNRLVASKSGVEATEGTSVNRPLTYSVYDNLNQVVAQERYDGDGVTPADADDDGVPDRPSASLLRARATTSYDEQGRTYRSETFSVDPTTGAVSATGLKSDSWYDPRGLTIKTAAPGGLVTKMAYDGAGRTTVTYTTDGGGDSGYADADDVVGDIVLEQQEYAYDASGNVLQVTTRRRFHDATGTGALGTPTTGVQARVSYAGYYYDKADRLTDTVAVGTNGGTAWGRPSTVPARSDTVLVTSQGYDPAGRVETTTDPRGLVTKTSYDALGRTTKTVENYVDGIVSDGDDKTVEYTYDAAGHLLTLTARLTGGAYQTTGWVYGVSAAIGSTFASNDILSAMQYPDKDTGDPSADEQEMYTVNALGEVTTKTDRNGSVHTYSFDVVGRPVADAVTTLGSGVDGSIRRIETAYDSAGLAYLYTSYDAAAGGTVVNQVRRVYNGLGQLTREYQAVDGAVDPATTPHVGYNYSEMAGGANHSRLTVMTYPDGKVLSYNYAAGLDDAISRLSSLSDSSGILESYDYLGLGTVVRRAHPQPGVDLTYIKQAGENDGDAGDQYTGLDAFDRVIDQRWIRTSDGTATDRFQYGYDRDSNRLYRENLVDATFSELYSYDGLNQLTAFARGTLNAARDAIVGTPTQTQEWDFDALGNFDVQTTDGVTETRSHDAQNQITSISGLSSPAYDGNGNMTGDEQGRTLVYDAWNRLVRVTEDGTTLIAYTHDALGRRVTEGNRVLYYSAAWQVIEERESGIAVVQTVFSPVYIDALVLRDRDTDGNGTLDERLWPQQDANYNVTALLDGTGVVVERYAYGPFGSATVLTATFAARTGSGYAWVYLHQGGRYEVLTGLYHFRHREYSPTLGVWLTADPLGLRQSEVNCYRYQLNSPLSQLDPSGLIGLKEMEELVSQAREECNRRYGGDPEALRRCHDKVNDLRRELIKQYLEEAKQQRLKNESKRRGDTYCPLPPIGAKVIKVVPIVEKGKTIGAVVTTFRPTVSGSLLLLDVIIFVTINDADAPLKSPCNNALLLKKTMDLTGGFEYKWQCPDGRTTYTHEPKHR